MDTPIITALISLVGSVIVALITKVGIANDLKTKDAVMETKLEELTREVRAHNNFAQRMPVVEEQIKVINHRLDDLERK